MPEINGFDVVKRVGVYHMPVSIFVTAYDRYALRAFEAHALDYLLKPFGKARFLVALGRAKQHIAGKLNREALRNALAMLGEIGNQSHYPEHLPVTQHGHIVLVNTAEIDWIEADGNYARLHIGAHQYEVRETLTGIHGKLNPLDFVRIHRSTIVAVRSIKEIHPWLRGHHLVVLNSGKELRMSVARRLGVGWFARRYWQRHPKYDLEKRHAAPRIRVRTDFPRIRPFRRRPGSRPQSFLRGAPDRARAASR